MKHGPHGLAIEVGGKVGALVPDGGRYLTGTGYTPTMEIRKETMNNSVSFCVSSAMSWLPFDRRTARRIANEILELLGPETEADKDDTPREYRHPL